MSVHLLHISTVKLEVNNHSSTNGWRYARLGLEVCWEALAVNEHVTSNRTAVDPLGKDVQQSRLASTRLSHQCSEFAGGDVAEDVGKKSTIIFSGDGDGVDDVLPGEDVRLGSRAMLRVDGGRGTGLINESNSGFSLALHVVNRAASIRGFLLSTALEERDSSGMRGLRVVLGEEHQDDGQADSEGNRDTQVL